MSPNLLMTVNTPKRVCFPLYESKSYFMHFMPSFYFTPLIPQYREPDTKRKHLICIFIGNTQTFNLYFAYKVIDSSFQIHSHVCNGHALCMSSKF